MLFRSCSSSAEACAGLVALRTRFSAGAVFSRSRSPSLSTARFLPETTGFDARTFSFFPSSSALWSTDRLEPLPSGTGAAGGAADRDGFGAKKLEIDCCFVRCDKLDCGGLLFGAIEEVPWLQVVCWGGQVQGHAYLREGTRA